DVEGRLRACHRILERAVAYGVPLERIFLDSLALPLSVDTEQGMVTLRTLEQIKARWPRAKTTLGLSNTSYGLPLRGVINRALLLMAMYLGLDSVILDPLDARLMANIRAARVVLGGDPLCKGYLKDYRKGRIRE
ncbi:MAG: dihydropteroate synthase, partial [Dehalococcoidia bacterium]